MKSVLRICFYAILASLAVISISCGDDPKPVPEPATNTAIDATNANTLVGNYKVISFNALDGAVSSDNYSQVQDIIGQSTINIENNKLVLKSKAQIESTFAQRMVQDTFNFINVDSLPPVPIDTTAGVDGVFGSMSGTPAIGLTIKVNSPTTVTATQNVPAAANVLVVFVLEKVNDAVIDLEKDKKYWNVANMNTTNASTAMATLLSYYRIDNVTYPGGTKSEESINSETHKFNGNLQINANIADIANMSIDFVYKFQDGVTTEEKFKYVFDTAKLKIVGADALDIPGAFTKAGAVIEDDKMHLTITFKPSTSEFSHALGLAADTTLVMKLTKLYDPGAFIKSVIDKKYW